ncbi:MAG: hypothetical protein J6Y97_12880 [Prevotella sp.]|nr:hypothetical protein [Prevotella sp.]MBP5508754.1 hypothetical protein [Prevotella sp.]
MRKRVRLTEGDLHRIVRRSVNGVLREVNDGTAESAESDFLEYADRYGIEAFGHAIYKMIESGEMKVNFEMANLLWEYGGSCQ